MKTNMSQAFYFQTNYLRELEARYDFLKYLGIELSPWQVIKREFNLAQIYFSTGDPIKSKPHAEHVINATEMRTFLERKESRFGRLANYKDHTGIYAVYLFSCMMAGHDQEARAFIQRCLAEVSSLPDSWKREDVLYLLLLAIHGQYTRGKAYLEPLSDKGMHWLYEIFTSLENRDIHTLNRIIINPIPIPRGIPYGPFGRLPLFLVLVMYDIVVHMENGSNYLLLNSSYF